MGEEGGDGQQRGDSVATAGLLLPLSLPPPLPSVFFLFLSVNKYRTVSTTRTNAAASCAQEHVSLMLGCYVALLHFELRSRLHRTRALFLERNAVNTPYAFRPQGSR